MSRRQALSDLDGTPSIVPIYALRAVCNRFVGIAARDRKPRHGMNWAKGVSLHIAAESLPRSRRADALATVLRNVRRGLV